jgi:endonuclease G
MKIPSALNQAAHARVQQTQIQRHKALQAIASGRPLDAEPDPERLTRRIEAVRQVSPREAMSLAKSLTSATPPTLARGTRGKEVVQGSTVDFLDVAFLELALAASSCVARVAFTNRRPQGSGFMVSDRLFMTNNHVIPSPSEAGQFILEFDYQRDVFGTPKTPTRFALAPDVFFLTSAETEFDFTIIAVGKRIDGAHLLDDYGSVPLLARGDKHVMGELVNVIQHPDGDFKQTVIRENQLVTRLETVLHYVADSMPGSSGSPVFNDQWEAIALHHWGEPFTEASGPGGAVIRHDVNEGIRISAILRKLTAMRGQLGDNTKRRLLDAVLEPKFNVPGRLHEALDKVASHSSTSRFPTTEDTSPVTDGNTATWTIPLRISVNLGGPQPPTATTPSDPSGTPVNAAKAAPDSSSEKVTIELPYTNRSGYDPAFLKGFNIPLPKLTASQKKKAAELLKPAPGADPLELKYTHYSIVMNAERRLAFFTACNIDGTSWINIDRDTNLPKESAEASEVWYADDRIAPETQCNQADHYDKQKPKRIFDRGHLVRRQDPSWGTVKRAIRANADTFHFTNCTPQASTFNQTTSYWQGIEQYILEDNVVADKDRITVFTGPVFGSKDKPYRDIHVPAKFWKVIVRVQDDELVCNALLADQSQFIKKMPESFDGSPESAAEDWDTTTKVDNYLSTVAEIETLTGLDFGVLRDHDVRSGGESSSALISSFTDIPLHKPKAAARKVSRRQR